MHEPSQEAPAPSLGDWFTPGKFGALLALLIVAFFPEVIFGTRSFYFRDFLYYGYPLAQHLRESFWQGEVPLWNPLSNCGLPFLAQWSTLVCYPFSLIFILLPLTWGLGLFCLAHLWLAGFGMYLLARRWTGNNFAAAVAGLLFAFNGFTLSCLIWPHYLVFLGWSPLVFLWTQRAWQEGGRAVILAALAGAMQMLSGMPEFTLLFWLMLSVWWLAGAGRREFPWKISLGRFAAVVLLIAGLTALQTLPFLELVRNCSRSGGYDGGKWALPLNGWANFLLPLYNCEKVGPGVFLQYDQNLFSSYYQALLWLPLGGLVLWRPGRGPARLLGGIILASLLLSLGEAGYLYAGLKWLFPPLGFMRYPVKFLFPAMFCLPLLVALALPVLLEMSREHWARTQRFFIISGLLGLGLIAALVWHSHRYQRGLVDQLALQQNAVTRGAFLVAELFLLERLMTATGLSRRKLFAGTLLLLAWLDVATHVPNQNPTVPCGVYEEKIPALEALRPRPRPGQSRLLASIKLLQDGASLIAIRDPVLTGLSSRLAFRLNCNLLEGMPAANGGFYSLYLRHHGELTGFFHLTETAPRPFWADFLGVSQFPSATKKLAWEGRTDFLPMLTAGQAPVFVAEPQAALTIGTNTLDPRASVFLPAEIRGEVRATNRAACTISNYSFAAHRVSATVASTAPALVVVAQTYYPAWKAYVDGRPVPLWRANHAFQALEIPDGRHEVVLRYEDRTFRIGAILSGLTLLGCLGGWVGWKKRAPAGDSPATGISGA